MRTQTDTYICIYSRAHTERLSNNNNKSIKKTMAKGARQLAAAEVGSCCCCGGYWMKCCCCCGCKHLTPQAKLKLASHTLLHAQLKREREGESETWLNSPEAILHTHSTLAVAIFFDLPFTRKGVINFAVVCNAHTHTDTHIHSFLIILVKSGFLTSFFRSFPWICIKTFFECISVGSLAFLIAFHVKLKLFPTHTLTHSHRDKDKCNWGVA